MILEVAAKGDGGVLSRLGDAIDAVVPVFQPVLWLDDLSIAGYESLARGPLGSPFERPTDLFEAAKTAGRITELDATMTRRSIEATEAVDWHPSLTMFGNLDPEAMCGPPDVATLEALGRAAARGSRIVVEVTERALLARPSALVMAADVVRMQGFGIAMDDVGADPSSLTLLPILRPDVVKLDMSILHRPFDTLSARVGGAVRTYCDQTGALLVCEGIETAAHELRARALGADLVQGFRYGRPLPLPPTTMPTSRPVPLLDRTVAVGPPLREQLATVERRSLSGRQLAATVGELVSVVAGPLSGNVVIGTAPRLAHVVPSGFLEVLERAVPHSAMVAMIVPGCPPDPAPGVRGIDASAAELLGSPWSMSAIGPGMAASMLAEDSARLNDPVAHRLVHSRPLVGQIMRLLLGLMAD